MPSFSDSIFLFILALLLFGPKRLPVLARELGKWMGEFRKASNEFKMQMEEELRLTEQADRQKHYEAIQAAAPAPPPLTDSTTESAQEAVPEPTYPEPDNEITSGDYDSYYTPPSVELEPIAPAPAPTPVPIATSGDLSIMPPATGLPIGQTRNSSLSSLINSIPSAEPTPEPTHPTEPTAHGA